MQVKLRGNRVAVEKLKTQSKNKSTQFLVVPNSEEYLGVIKFVGPDASKDLQVGQRVYFSRNFQQVRIESSDLCVLEDKEIYAITE